MTDTCPECRPLREALMQGQRDLVTVAQEVMHLDLSTENAEGYKQAVVNALRHVGLRLAEAAEG